ncbi:MAG: hypothetical protein OEW35_04335 [Gammaproteobacteria bacterium]|nr:hypothetical protein [Gammaproteobacteria bacterium]MDH4254009.1 hypothetical protein [Gammaproteobacteria bacterium]MDH5311131.1 hypothetical protein [Gammaproteobacteria bacterium]
MTGIKRMAAMVALALLAGASSADTTADADSIRAAYAALARSEAPGGQQWFELAQQARNAGVLDVSAEALARAESAGFSPVRVSLEQARVQVASGDAAAAVASLQALVAAGFGNLPVVRDDPVFATLAGQPAYDQLIDGLTRQAYPCRYDETFRDFDFWVGEWDVHLANGQVAGSNRIASAESGCVLIENWIGASGSTGMSVNYLDKATGEWVQVWNSEGGAQISIRGALTDEGMLLAGQIHYVGNGTTAPFRGLWTPLPDGRVRQFFEQSNDGGATWTPWFEGFYTRRSPPE